MKVEIITVGNELVKGSIVDTNSKYIAEECELAGLEVMRHACIGDYLDIFVQILTETSQRTDIIVISGGLGPTPDDLAREAAAISMGVELQLDEMALKELELKFQKLKKPMPEENKKQAYFPLGATRLTNPIGTAAGFYVTLNKVLAFFIPGVPREMKLMFKEQILPFIFSSPDFKTERSEVVTYKTFGLSEAVIGGKLKSLHPYFPKIEMGTRYITPSVELKLYAKGEESLRTLPDAKRVIAETFNAWIYSENQQEMASNMINAFRQNRHDFALIEVDSGGLIPFAVSSVYGASEVVRRSSIIAPSTHLAINESIALLAKEARRDFQTTYGVAIWGIHNQTQAETYFQEEGQVYIALCGIGHIDHFACCLPYGNEEYKRTIFAMLLLDLLRRKALGIPFLSEVLGKKLVHNSLLEI